MHSDYPVRDSEQAHQVSGVWRDTIREIVDALASGDHRLSRPIESLVSVTAATADQIHRYLENYGETLTQLPNEAWDSSVAQWTGTHWDLLIDLWTVESGRSDLVLDLRVFPFADGFRFEIHAVYVP